VGPQLRDGLVALEGDAAGQRLVEDAAEGVDVAAGVELVALDLLGRGVVGGAHPLAGLGHLGGCGGDALGQPEIGQVRPLSAALVADQQVGRLHVAVHQPARVRGVQRPADLIHEGGRALGLQP
jgi:hypothetical protein